MTEVFRFFHISDIHFQQEKIKATIERDKLRRKLIAINPDPDCLLISGDIFYQGKLDEDTARITTLDDFPNGKHIIVCPGNHDLDRNARVKVKNTYGVFTTRKELVNKYGEKVSGEKAFCFNDAEKEVLYKNAFKGFIDYSQEHKFETFNKPDAVASPENYEFNIYYQTIKTGKACVRFVLLNTALLAGQTLDNESYKKRVEAQYTKVKEANCPLDELKARCALEQLLANNDDIIIDGEESVRFGLSTDGLTKLRDEWNNIPSDPIVATFFVGHHGWSYLGDETRELLKALMQPNDIYLCGHIHKPDVSKFDVCGNIGIAYQYTAGAMFYDPTNWARYSFNDICITQEGFVYHVSVTCYHCEKNPVGVDTWYHTAPIIVDHIGQIPASKDEVPYEIAPKGGNKNETSGNERILTNSAKTEENVHIPNLLGNSNRKIGEP